MYIFESLETYKKAVQFSAVASLATQDFPKSTTYFVDRLNLAAENIGKQIAKAHSSWKDEDRKAGFWKARELVLECQGFVDIASRQGFFSETLRDQLRILLGELSKLLQDNIRGSSEWKNKAKFLDQSLLNQGLTEN